MFNISKAFLDGTFDPEYFRYCFDRAAQAAAKSAGAFAADTAANERSSADAARAQLTPFYRQEMNAKHLYDPGQLNEMLNYAGAASAGEGGTTAGEAASQAARTRNTSGFSAALDQNARDRQKAVSTANLGIGAQDIMGAKQLNQEGAAGMAGLYGIDTNAMLGAMGRRNEAIQTQIEAGKSGWFQNLMKGIETLTGGAKNAGEAFTAFGG